MLVITKIFYIRALQPKSKGTIFNHHNLVCWTLQDQQARNQKPYSGSRLACGLLRPHGRLVYSRFDSKNDEHKELVDKGRFACAASFLTKLLSRGNILVLQGEDWISEPVLLLGQMVSDGFAGMLPCFLCEAQVDSNLGSPRFANGFD